MVRVSNNLLGIINIITFLISIPILVAGVWLSRQDNTECVHYFVKPFIVMGAFLMIMSIAGIIGTCCEVSWLLCLYLFVMLVLIVMLMVYTIFVFAVTNKGVGQSLSGKGYKEYRLGDYSNWLQKQVNNNKDWSRIVSCLQDGNVCQSLRTDDNDDFSNTPAYQFYWKPLSAIQSGCCKPSDTCNFTYVSPTIWTTTTEAVPNSDCALWDNDPNVLCFNCQSCKAGILDNMKSNLKKVAVVYVIALVCLIVVYSIGCCAFRNNREDDLVLNRRYP